MSPNKGIRVAGSRHSGVQYKSCGHGYIPGYSDDASGGTGTGGGGASMTGTPVTLRITWNYTVIHDPTPPYPPAGLVNQFTQTLVLNYAGTPVLINKSLSAIGNISMYRNAGAPHTTAFFLTRSGSDIYAGIANAEWSYELGMAPWNRYTQSGKALIALTQSGAQISSAVSTRSIWYDADTLVSTVNIVANDTTQIITDLTLANISDPALSAYTITLATNQAWVSGAGFTTVINNNSTIITPYYRVADATDTTWLAIPLVAT